MPDQSHSTVPREPVSEPQSLTANQWIDLYKWAADQDRKPPESAFTSGLLRDAATAVFLSLPGPQRDPATAPDSGGLRARIAARTNPADADDDLYWKALEEAGHTASKLPKPIASIYISNDGKLLQIHLDTSRPYYGDWIKGEGADICLMRDQETKRVVGATLPLYAKCIDIGGDKIPDAVYDIATGAVISQTTDAEPDATASEGKDRLTKDDPPGWYECRKRDALLTKVVNWNGSAIHNDGCCLFGAEQLDYTDFFPLIPATALAERDRRLAEARQEIERLKQHWLADDEELEKALVPALGCALTPSGHANDERTGHSLALEAAKMIERLKAENNVVKMIAGWEREDERPADSAAMELVAEIRELRQSLATANAAREASEQLTAELMRLLDTEKAQVDRQCVLKMRAIKDTIDLRARLATAAEVVRGPCELPPGDYEIYDRHRFYRSTQNTANSLFAEELAIRLPEPKEGK